MILHTRNIDFNKYSGIERIFIIKEFIVLCYSWTIHCISEYKFLMSSLCVSSNIYEYIMKVMDGDLL